MLAFGFGYAGRRAQHDDAGGRRQSVSRLDRRRVVGGARAAQQSSGRRAAPIEGLLTATNPVGTPCSYRMPGREHRRPTRRRSTETPRSRGVVDGSRIRASARSSVERGPGARLQALLLGARRRGGCAARERRGEQRDRSGEAASSVARPRHELISEDHRRPVSQGGAAGRSPGPCAGQATDQTRFFTDPAGQLDLFRTALFRDRRGSPRNSARSVFARPCRCLSVSAAHRSSNVEVERTVCLESVQARLTAVTGESGRASMAKGWGRRRGWGGRSRRGGR